MFKSIRLQHFRSFEEEAEAVMAPITLIYGANSAGKSSIIKSLLLLKQSYGDGGRGAAGLRFDGPLVDLGSARAAAFGHRFDSPVRISISFELEAEVLAGVSGEITFEIASDEAKDDRVEICFHIDGEDFTLRFEERVGTERNFVLEEVSEARFYSLMRVVCRRNSGPSLFDVSEVPANLPLFAAVGLLPNEIVDRGSRRPVSKRRPITLTTEELEWNRTVAPTLQRILASAVDRVSYLGPLRKAPNRFELLDRSSGLSGVGKQGEYSFSVLKRDETLLSRVNRSLREHLESPYALELPVWPDESGGDVRDLLPVSIVPILRHTASDVAISIADAGFGLSQLLPFLIEMHSREDTLICIEQPELHLHPRLQSRMAETLLNSLQSANKNRFLIETHSEHLLLRLQRMIREQRLRSKDVSLLYVDNQVVEYDEHGEVVRSGSALASQIVEIRLDKYGDMIDPWPGGFFDERLEELGWTQ